MRISDWSSDVCSSDLFAEDRPRDSSGRAHHWNSTYPLLMTVRSRSTTAARRAARPSPSRQISTRSVSPGNTGEEKRTSNALTRAARSEEHTSELQSLMRISYAVFCLKKKTQQ